MRKKKIGVLLLGFFLLFMFYGGRFFYKAGKEVLLSDITFLITAKGEEAELKLWHNYYDGKEYLFLPSFCQDGAACQIKQENRLSGEWNGQKLYNWTKPVTLETGEYVYETGAQKFQVVVMKSQNIPALFLTTQSGSLEYIEAEKGNGESGMYRMITKEGAATGEGRVDKLRSRGNATFLEDKKPYQMNLDIAEDLLGAGAASKYILLANRQDQSLLRDKILYDLAADIGLAYSPKSQHVDLYINGEYRGNYQLCEKVETGENRVSIDTSGTDSGMGFLVEFEYAVRKEEMEYFFVTKNGQHVQIRSPENPTQAQSYAIQERFQQVEDDIRNGRLAESDIDVTSFARKYLIEEISKNLDAMYSSQYFYKDEDRVDGKVYAGPVWDYDKSLGNPFIEKTRPVNYQEPWGIFAATKQDSACFWYDLYEQPYFYEAMVKEYEETLLPAVENMLEEKIHTYRDEIKASAHMDYMRWDTFEDFKNGEELEFEAAYEGEIQWIKDFLKERTDFLNHIWLEGRTYNQVTCDPAEGTMYVTQIDGVEGRPLKMPADPKLEGYRFKQWVKKDTGQVYDFTQNYDGVPFTLVAQYEKKEE